MKYISKLPTFILAALLLSPLTPIHAADLVNRNGSVLTFDTDCQFR